MIVLLLQREEYTDYRVEEETMNHYSYYSNHVGSSHKSTVLRIDGIFNSEHEFELSYSINGWLQNLVFLSIFLLIIF